MRRWGSFIGLTIAILLVAVPAGAHGVHGSVPAALGQQVGPYTLSLWIEYDNNESVRASAQVEASSGVPSPDLWVVGNDGLRRDVDGLKASANSWTVQFDSRLGDSLIVSWTTAAGESLERAILIEEAPTPVWLQMSLVMITAPGLWFVMWLWRRRSRAFSVHTPAI